MSLSSVVGHISARKRCLIIPSLLAASQFSAIPAHSAPCPQNLIEAAKKIDSEQRYAARDEDRYCDGLLFSPHSGALTLVSLTLGGISISPDTSEPLKIVAPPNAREKVIVIGQRLEPGQTYRFDTILDNKNSLQIRRDSLLFALGGTNSNIGMIGTATIDGQLVRIPVQVGSPANSDVFITVRSSAPLVRMIFDFLDPASRKPFADAPRIVKEQIPGGEAVQVKVAASTADRRLLFQVKAQTAGGDIQTLSELILVPKK